MSEGSGVVGVPGELSPEDREREVRAERIRLVVDALPPLTQEQEDILALLFRGSA